MKDVKEVLGNIKVRFFKLFQTLTEIWAIQSQFTQFGAAQDVF